MKKILRITAKVLICFIALLALSMLVGFILQKTYYTKELSKIKPYGQMVEVDGGKMHVYQMGNGDKTIVLLSGYSIALPSANFGSLMRNLSADYRVVVVEHLGTGFSEQTDKPRTSENYVNEMREALNQAGIIPPYILMPHSISGIYSEYYASQYPDEVEGLILLDTTPTTDTLTDVDRNAVSMVKTAKFLQDVGLFRIVISLAPDESVINSNFNGMLAGDHTRKELEDFGKHRSFSFNNTTLKQMENIKGCIDEVKAFSFPRDIPVLKIIAKDTFENEVIGGEEYQTDHLKRIGDHAESVVLEGTHMIYYTQIDEIKRLTDEFVSKLNGELE